MCQYRWQGPKPDFGREKIQMNTWQACLTKSQRTWKRSDKNKKSLCSSLKYQFVWLFDFAFMFFSPLNPTLICWFPTWCTRSKARSVHFLLGAGPTLRINGSKQNKTCCFPPPLLLSPWKASLLPYKARTGFNVLMVWRFKNGEGFIKRKASRCCFHLWSWSESPGSWMTP